jgi:hypothetical protein
MIHPLDWTSFMIKCKFLYDFFFHICVNNDIDALLSPLLDPLEGLNMLNCGKLGLEGRSWLLALKGGKGVC